MSVPDFDAIGAYAGGRNWKVWQRERGRWEWGAVLNRFPDGPDAGKPCATVYSYHPWRWLAKFRARGYVAYELLRRLWLRLHHHQGPIRW